MYGTSGDVIAASHASAVAWRASPVTSSGRPPIRSVSAPAIGATIIGMPVHGSIRRPASSGEFPCTFWRYWVKRKIDPNIPKNMRSDAALAAAKVRFRKNRIGSIGSRARRSQATNATRRMTPATSDRTISGLVHPRELARTRPHTRPSADAVMRPTPVTSSRAAGP